MAGRSQQQTSAKGKRTSAAPRASSSRRAAPAARRSTPARKAPAKKRPATPPRTGRRLPASVIPIAALVGLLMLGWWFYPLMRMGYAEERQKARYQAELVQVQERNARLKAEVERLKTPEGVEQAAREQLSLARPGERVYVVTETGTPEPKASTEETPAPAADNPMWRRVLDAVFGLR